MRSLVSRPPWPDQGPVGLFGLAIGALPMLETARIGGEV